MRASRRSRSTPTTVSRVTARPTSSASSRTAAAREASAGSAEPTLGKRRVVRVDGASGEGDISRQEPVVERSFDDEHLRSIRAVANPDQGRRLPDLFAHRSDATRPVRWSPWTCATPSRARSGTTARSRSPNTWSSRSTVPGGFFEDPPVGPDGHFVTSPHVHPVFAELLGRAIGTCTAGWASLGPSASPRSGRATARSRDSSSTTSRTLDVDYTAVETSSGRPPGARHDRRDPCVGAARRIPAPDPGQRVMDNLPFRRLRGTTSGTKEVLIGLDGDRSW